MRNCTISAPVESCTAVSPATPNTRFAAVQLLTDQFLYFIVEPKKTRTKEVFAQTCLHLSGKGQLDTELFGLATLTDGEYLFADPDYKVLKYAPKSWKSSSTHGLDSNGKPLLVFYFRVQFYVESPLLLRHDASRHLYYLQLRHNVQVRGLFHVCASEEVLFLLAGLALQADLGDYEDAAVTNNKPYFRAQDYFPQQMVKNAGEMGLVQMVSSLHRANHGLTKAEAEAQYIRTSPLTHNSHLYRLNKHKKQDAGPGTVLLAICTRGIQLYEENSTKALTSTLLWNNIGKLYFNKKKFEIKANWQPSGQKLTYYTNCDEKSKHHLALCKVTHQFSMAVQPRLAEVRRKEADEAKRYREWGGKLSGVDYNSHRADQRISVISSTSSNTTSGIVSDRVHSLDESEDDLDMEVMINSPPAASVESLALAHLHDSLGAGGVSASTSDQASPSPLSLADHTLLHPHSCASVEIASQECNIMTKAVSLVGGSTTPATTDGSQCSSSCSTVVVAGCPPETVSPTEEQNGVIQRRGSASSSLELELELGFSHTAQNSAISDSTSTCLELDYSVQSAHTSSGVYTLRSSTLANTVACSSETSGIGVDESEGHRSRSGSLVSASGSFHGDGSDPSDAGRGTLLTAEELSDLIVRRSPKPRRGVYPSRATVSSTLDSDSDYVTLPPPPLPPPRSDSEAHSRNYVLVEQEQPSLSPYHEESLMNCRKVMEETILQQQIQFQHLASPYSPQLMLPPKAQQYLGMADHITLVNAPPHPPPHPPEETNARFIANKPHILTAHTALLPASPYSHGTYVPEPRKYPLDPASRMKAHPPNLIPVVGSNNYLDVRGSGAAFLQHYHQKFPPPPHPRQPPPPPPPPPPRPTLATVYTSQVTRSQIEQFKQQLYSDVDYVIYPMQDPAISKQEYMDSKVALSHYNPPPPYGVYSNKSRVICRSTPNVAVAGSYIPVGSISTSPIKYASNQNLADYPGGSTLSFMSSHHPSSTSPLYSAGASYSSSSTQSLRYDPVTLQLVSPVLSGGFTRTQSDDNILNCAYDKQPPVRTQERPAFRRPPPPLPPPYDIQNHCEPEVLKRSPHAPHAAQNKAVFPSSLSKAIPEEQPRVNEAKGKGPADGVLDIRTLREKSQKLDLPLISALCNDRSLLKQTNAFVMPKHPGGEDRPLHAKTSGSGKKFPMESKNLGTERAPEAAFADTSSAKKSSLFASFLSAGGSGPATPPKYAAASSSSSSSSKLKYPVSGLSTNQIVKPGHRHSRAATSRHTHPPHAPAEDVKVPADRRTKVEPLRT